MFGLPISKEKTEVLVTEEAQQQPVLWKSQALGSVDEFTYLEMVTRRKKLKKLQVYETNIVWQFFQTGY